MKSPIDAEARASALLVELDSELRDCSFLLRQLVDVSFALPANPTAAQVLRQKEARIVQLATELKATRVRVGISSLARFDRWRSKLVESDVRLRWRSADALAGLELLRGEPANAGAYTPPARQGTGVGLWMNMRSAP